MLSISLKRVFWILQNHRLRLFIVLLIIGGIGLWTVQDYGISWDEAMEIDMVGWHWNYASRGIPYPVPLIQYYGIVFNGFCELLYLIRTHTNTIITSEVQQIKSVAWIDKIYFKHLITFLWTFVGYLVTSRIVHVIVAPEESSGLRSNRNFRLTGYWITPLILALFPRFWGHSYFNPKDIPFAVLFTATTLVGSNLISAYLGNIDNSKTLIRKSFFYGFLVGLLGGVRPIGIVALFFIGAIYIFLIEKKSNWIRHTLRVFPYYFLSIVTSLSTVVILYPSAWSSPLTWLLEAFLALGKYPITIIIFFLGNYFSSGSVPWYYIPTWMLITVPEILSMLFLFGIVFSFLKYQTLSQLQRSTLLLTSLQIAFLPLMAIVNRSPLYDEIRHFIFVIPGIAVFCSIGIIWLESSYLKKHIKYISLTVILLCMTGVAIDMNRLHPYEYMYFNQLAGGLSVVQDQYELDYWGLSLKDSSTWLNAQLDSAPQLVLILGPISSIKPFLKPNFEVVQANFKNGLVFKPKMTPYHLRAIMNEAIILPSIEEDKNRGFYVVALRRMELNNLLPDCSIVHELKHSGVTLNVIRKCPPRS